MRRASEFRIASASYCFGPRASPVYDLLNAPKKLSMALDIDISGRNETYFNLSPATLAEIALLRGEGRLSSSGAIVVETGKRTGTVAG